MQTGVEVDMGWMSSRGVSTKLEEVLLGIDSSTAAMFLGVTLRTLTFGVVKL